MKHVHKQITRHGKVTYYYKPFRSAPKIRLPDELGSDEFREALKAAELNSAPAPRKPTPDDLRRRRIERSLRRGIENARQRARTKKIAFALDLDWALDQVEQQELRCGLTGIPFFAKTATARNPFAPSFDQIIPSGGYTKDNVRIVCHAVNIMMSDWGAPVFNKVAAGYFVQRTKSKQSMHLPFDSSALT